MFAYPLCGFLVGALVGLTGMAGGSVMTALLILVFGVHPITAVGTDLLYAAVTKSAGAHVHAGKGNVVWPLVGWLAIGSVPGTLLTIFMLSRVASHSPALARAITLIIGVALIVAALNLLLQRNVLRLSRQSGVDQELETIQQQPSRRPLMTILLGLLLGVFVSLTSVGAGALGIVILRQLHPQLASVRLVGTDIAHAVPLTLLAGCGHWLIGDVDWKLLGLLLVGSIPGIMVASHFAHHLPEQIMRTLLGLVLLAIAIPIMIH